MPAIASTKKGRAVVTGRSARRGATVASDPRPRFRTEIDYRTHVLIPIEEYEQLLQIAEIREIEAKLTNPATEWVPWERAAREIAANHVVRARKAAGLTQRQLAQKARMPQSQVARIERDPAKVTVRTLKRLASVLGVDVSTLLRPL